MKTELLHFHILEVGEQMSPHTHFIQNQMALFSDVILGEKSITISSNHFHFPCTLLCLLPRE